MAVMATISASALTFTVDGIQYTTITNSQVKVTGGTRNYIYIGPTVTYNGTTYDIWCIDDGAFKNSTTAQYLEIDSEGFAYIGEQAFMGCTNLKQIKFTKVAPDCQFSIEKEAFSGCNNSELTSVAFPENGMYMLGSYAFNNCTSLIVVYFRDIEYLSESAFLNCTNLVTVDYENTKTVKTLDGTHTTPDNALTVSSGNTSPFYPLRYTLKHVEVYGGQVQDFLFQGFTNIETVSINSLVTRIGKSAFNGCTQLSDFSMSSVGSDSELQEIGDYAFRNCPITTDLSFWSQSLTRIGLEAFKNHQAEKIAFSLYQGAGLTIGEDAFKSDKTKSIHLYGNITSIGHNAFACPNAETITYRASGNTDPYQSTDFYHSLFTNCNKVKTLDVNVSFEIKSYTFANMTIEKATINCKNITEHTFYNTAIKEVTLTISQTKDYNGCPFSYSKETLTSLTFGGGYKHIPAYLAYGLKKLTDFTFDKTIQSIGKYAFAGTGLSNIVFQYNSDGLNSIEDYAFSGCTNLRSIKCPYYIPPTLGTGVFADCVDDLKSVQLTVPSGAERNYKLADGWKEFYDVYIEYPISMWNGYRQDIRLSNENNSAIEGSVYYNYTTNTLVLNNTSDYFDQSAPDYQYGGNGISEIWIDQDKMPSHTLTIQLVGNNRIGTQIHMGSLYSETKKACNVVITGEGSLLCEGSITMSGGQVTFDNVKNCNIGGIFRSSENVSATGFPPCQVLVDHSQLTLNAYQEGSVDVDEFELRNCEIVSPVGTVFQDNQLYADGALVPSLTDVVIEPTATGIEEILGTRSSTPAGQAAKVFDPETGNIYILRGGKAYNLQGARVK